MLVRDGQIKACTYQTGHNPSYGIVSGDRSNEARQNITSRTKFSDRSILLLDRQYVRVTLHREPRQEISNFHGESSRCHPQLIFPIPMELCQYRAEHSRRCFKGRVSKFSRALDSRTRVPMSIERRLAKTTSQK